MNINVTLFGQMITFLVFVWFTMKFVWPPIVKALRDRQQKIADGLSAAEQGKRELANSQTAGMQTVREARDKAALILDQANNRAAQIVEEAQGMARLEKDRILASAEKEIAQQMVRAKENLRDQVVSIAVLSAEKLLGTAIDTKTHQQLLNKLATEI